MRWRAFRKGLLKVHLWLAIILSLPMVLIGISGSALLVQREILNHSHPSATATGERKTIPELIAAAQKAAPQGAIAKRVDLPPSAGASLTTLIAVPTPKPSIGAPARTSAWIRYSSRSPDTRMRVALSPP